MEIKKNKTVVPSNGAIIRLSEEEQYLIRGRGYWDPNLGYVADEVTVYGDASVHWNNVGKHDLDNCPACGGYDVNHNSSQTGVENRSWNYCIHRLFHRDAYY